MLDEIMLTRTNYRTKFPLWSKLSLKLVSFFMLIMLGSIMLMRIFLVCNSIFVGYDENYHGNLLRECCETCTCRASWESNITDSKI